MASAQLSGVSSAGSDETPTASQGGEDWYGEVVIEPKRLIQLCQRCCEGAKEDWVLSQPDGREYRRAYHEAHAEHRQRALKALLAGAT
eukprot:CAMPEP_0115864826 /NCGR_PEP_ID=MMETSP0287-20121206/19403_1 /TAXON_ID=412157 /ORGANISM="Chrysochromulina rotalis, Strain UIO044" /LENGTH=87 /DNA_ID=CAMNT_0003319313 /DNA_START=392 /DNA_END=656 /DNA_ORIENTATION=+